MLIVGEVVSTLEEFLGSIFKRNAQNNY